MRIVCKNTSKLVRLSIVPLRDMETSGHQQQISHVPKFLNGTLGSVKKQKTFHRPAKGHGNVWFLMVNGTM
jgi:hypothetical protein